jgi:hypothetical protein
MELISFLKPLPVVFGILLPSISDAAPAASIKQGYEFVSAYIEGLADLEDIRRKAADDVSQPNENLVTSCIYNFTRLQSATLTMVTTLRGTDFPGELGELIHKMADAYEIKAKWQGRYIDDCSAMSSPSADQSAIIADLPKIRATFDDIDQTLFRVSPAIAMSLIDPTPDQQGRLNRLIVTRTQRAELIKAITDRFGNEVLTAPGNDPSYGVTTARVLRDFLMGKDHKSSDDP